MSNFKITPDLTNEFWPVPKTYKVKKPVKSMNKIGKRTEAWLGGHPALKETFKDHGVVSCEIFPYVMQYHRKLLAKYAFGKCKGAYHWGFAHKVRRGRLDVTELVDPHFVVLADNICHDIVDQQMPKKESEKLMQEIIDARGW
jgi:hypothetical protein